MCWSSYSIPLNFLVTWVENSADVSLQVLYFLPRLKFSLLDSTISKQKCYYYTVYFIQYVMQFPLIAMVMQQECIISSIKLLLSPKLIITWPYSSICTKLEQYWPIERLFGVAKYGWFKHKSCWPSWVWWHPYVKHNVTIFHCGQVVKKVIRLMMHDENIFFVL